MIIGNQKVQIIGWFVQWYFDIMSYIASSSENVLRLPPAPEQPLSSFSTISVLFLNRMQLHWQEVSISAIFHVR